VSASRAKGTAWESKVVTYLQSRGWPHAERRALRGKHDRGDVAGIVGIVIEAKSAARVELAAWLDEAHAEARHGDDIGVVWFHRRGKGSPSDGFVLMDGAAFVDLLIEAGYQR
jgi:hypothetical protein